jgi:uncharacterized protein (DUF433 family)
LDRNPKVNKPTNEKGRVRSADVKTPPSELDARHVKAHDAKVKSARVVREAKAGKGEIDSSKLVHRDGVAYVVGCDVAVWRLEMARRAGSDPAALTAAFPGLTLSGVDLAFTYARRHRAKFGGLIRRHGAPTVPGSDEGADDTAAFEAELDALLDSNADVFRRLAQ